MFARCLVDETMLRQFDPDLRSFFNVNTPDDLVERAGRPRSEVVDAFFLALIAFE